MLAPPPLQARRGVGALHVLRSDQAERTLPRVVARAVARELSTVLQLALTQRVDCLELTESVIERVLRGRVHGGAEELRQGCEQFAPLRSREGCCGVRVRTKIGECGSREGDHARLGSTSRPAEQPHEQRTQPGVDGKVRVALEADVCK